MWMLASLNPVFSKLQQLHETLVGTVLVGRLDGSVATRHRLRVRDAHGWDYGWQHVVFEGDNLQVVKFVQETDKHCLLPFGSSIVECISLSRSFESFSCYFVKRSDNSLAHALAHLHCVHLDVIADTFIPADLAHIL